MLFETMTLLREASHVTADIEKASPNSSKANACFHGDEQAVSCANLTTAPVTGSGCSAELTPTQELESSSVKDSSPAPERRYPSKASSKSSKSPRALPRYGAT